MTQSCAMPVKAGAVVTRLAAAGNLPIEEVAMIYERERDNLAVMARVTTFLDVFAARNVEQILRTRTVRGGGSL